MAAVGWVIRKAERLDLPRLHEIRRAAFAPIFASFRDLIGEDIARHSIECEEEAQGKHLDDLMDGWNGCELFVAEVGGRPVGFVTVLLDRRRRCGAIGLNAVDPSHAGKGIGTAMYEFALHRMREAGMVIATVGTGGDASHEPARRAYEKVGMTRGISSVNLYTRL